MSVLRKEYNQLLERYHKGFDYLSDNSIPDEKREQWLPQYEKICNRLNEIVAELNGQGVYPTNARLMAGI